MNNAAVFIEYLHNFTLLTMNTQTNTIIFIIVLQYGVYPILLLIFTIGSCNVDSSFLPWPLCSMFCILLKLGEKYAG